MGSMSMKVLIIGLPKFAKNLAQNLSDFDPNNKYRALNTYYNFVDKFRFIYHILNCDILYSLNGSIYKSRAFNLALKLNKKLIMHWVGTDVIKANAKYRNGVINKEYINNASHFCEVGWIKEELKELEIDANIVNFVSFNNNISYDITLPEHFSILTYIGENREIFYGINEINALAQEFPDIPINIIGISAYKETLPDNVKLLGWVENMDSLLRKTVLCIRFTKHDGLSSFVLEALAKGRHVAYRYNFPHCLWTEDFNSLIDTVNSLRHKFNQNLLSINKEGIKYIKEHFNKQFILSNLIKKFEEVLHGV